ncbi:hypothetical protein SDC9_43181 [bioreactor metagenome]|uniref:Uncharacterized protein n=1 Tax=bioreactor metagenome TaxID=1076179 RepID=A0A644VZR9_9ZZZZ
MPRLGHRIGAGEGAAVGLHEQIGAGAAAGVMRAGAARREGAARRQGARIGHGARDRHQPPPRPGHLRDRVEKAAGIGVARMRKQALDRARLDDPAGIHHADPLADLRDGAQIVADEDGGHAGLAPQPGQKFEDLRLDRGVKRSGRLVGDQQLGPAGERHRDHQPLALAAGKLVGVEVEAARRVGDADHLHQPDRLGLRRRAAQVAMEPQRLADLLAHPDHRVQRARRVLEDHRDALAAHRFQCLARRAHELARAQPDRARDPCLRRQEAKRREPGYRLAAARLAHQAKRLARRHVEVDAMQHRDAVEGDAQVADFHQSVHEILPKGARPAGAGMQSPGGHAARRGMAGAGGQPAAQFEARKSIAKAGAAFQCRSERMPVKTAFWCST